jgi:hypothetical protein
MSYLDKSEENISSENQSGANRKKEVTIECKSCRESNNVTIEY